MTVREPREGLSRRAFLAAGGTLLAGGALGGCRSGEGTTEITSRAVEIRRHRRLGRTGFQVGDVSFGGYPEDPNVVRYCYDHGVNYFDTAESYSDGECERRIGQALQHMDRKRVFITTKLDFGPEATKEELLDRYRDCLERLQTDYADALFIQGVQDLAMIGHEDFHAAADALKAEGRLRFVGIASHGPRGGEGDSMGDVLCAAAEDGRFDLMLLSYNFLNKEEAERVLACCKARDVGTTAMKTCPGVVHVDPVDPDNLTEEYQTYIDRVAADGVSRDEAIERIRRWVARQEETIREVRPFVEKYGATTNEELRVAGLQWVLTNEDMHTVCMGMGDFEGVDRFVSVSGTRLSAARARMLEDFELACNRRYCRHGCRECVASCPAGLPVSTIMRYSYYFTLQGHEKYAMHKYAGLRDQNAVRCIACHAPCNGSCPHGIEIQAAMASAHSLLTLV